MLVELKRKNKHWIPLGTAKSTMYRITITQDRMLRSLMMQGILVGLIPIANGV
jgi:hypothetical protein